MWLWGGRATNKSSAQAGEVEYNERWVSLPDEVLLQIFYYLPSSDLSVVAQVCQLWSRVAKDKYLGLRGDFMVIGTEVVDFVHFGSTRSIHRIIGRPIFGSWSEFDRRCSQDGNFLCFVCLNELKMVDLASARLLWSKPVAGTPRVLLEKEYLYVISESQVMRCDKLSGDEDCTLQLNSASLKHLRCGFTVIVAGVIMFGDYIVLTAIHETGKLIWVDKNSMEPIRITSIPHKATRYIAKVETLFKLRTHSLLACVSAVCSIHGERTREIAVFDLNGETVNVHVYSFYGEPGYNHLFMHKLDGCEIADLSLPGPLQYIQHPEVEVTASVAMVESPEGELFGTVVCTAGRISYYQLQQMALKDLDSGETTTSRELVRIWRIPFSEHVARLKAAMYNKTTLIVVAIPKDQLSPPKIMGIDALSGKVRWTHKTPALTFMAEHAREPDAKLRLVGSSIHFFFLAFGMGFHVTVLDIKDGRQLFAHKRTWEEFHNLSAVGEQCLVS